MYYCLDPGGDVVLNLRHAKARFAPWNDEEEYYSYCLNHQFGQTTTSVQFEDESEPLQHPHNLEVDPTEQDSPNQSEAVIDTPASASTSEVVVPTTDGTTSFRTSSRHLILASKHFEQALSKNWREGHVLHHNGETVIELKDWDVEALLILLNIIHGRIRSVPRSVDIEMLAKLAILIDYYQCLEVTEVFAEMWMAGLKDDPPTEYSRDLILWIHICCVFDYAEGLKPAMHTVVDESRGPVQMLDLPIPAYLITQMNYCREESMTRFLSFLDTLYEQLLLGEEVCLFECTSIRLGALLKWMRKQRLCDPQPEPPFLGLNLVELYDSLRQFREPQWRVNPFQQGLLTSHPNRLCGLKHLIVSEMDRLLDYIEDFWNEVLPETGRVGVRILTQSMVLSSIVSGDPVALETAHGD